MLLTKNVKTPFLLLLFMLCTIQASFAEVVYETPPAQQEQLAKQQKTHKKARRFQKRLKNRKSKQQGQFIFAILGGALLIIGAVLGAIALIALLGLAFAGLFVLGAIVLLAILIAALLA